MVVIFSPPTTRLTVSQEDAQITRQTQPIDSSFPVAFGRGFSGRRIRFGVSLLP